MRHVSVSSINERRSCSEPVPLPTPGVAFSTAANDSLVTVGRLEGVTPLGPGGAAARVLEVEHVHPRAQPRQRDGGFACAQTMGGGAVSPSKISRVKQLEHPELR